MSTCWELSSYKEQIQEYDMTCETVQFWAVSWNHEYDQVYIIPTQLGKAPIINLTNKD